MTIFSRPELERRQELFRRRLGQLQVDAAFIHTADNVYYLSGMPLLSEWGRPVYMAATPGGDALIVGAMLEKENLERFAHVASVHVFDDRQPATGGALDAVISFLLDVAPKAGRLGIERAYLPLGLYERFTEAFPDATFVDIGAILAEQRIVKSEEEVAILNHAAEAAKVGARAFLEALRPGVSELEVAAAAVNAIDSQIAEQYPAGATSSYAYCHFGDHTLTPHLHPTGRRLERGEVIALNVFPVVWGYCIELERTLIVGEAGEDRQRVLAAVDQAHETAKSMVEPGMRLSEVDRVASAILRDHGLGEYIRHGTGHAHGIMVGASGREELGELRPYNENVFKPGMFTSIEPGVYIPGLGGFRHSDVLMVTEGGASWLTDLRVPESVVLQ